MVLGNIVEMNFRQAVMREGSYGVFFRRPVSCWILVVALLSFAVPFLRKLRKKDPLRSKPDWV